MQHKSLLKTEDIDLQFTDEALREIAKYTYDMNKTHENIGMLFSFLLRFDSFLISGARRLNTVLEKVLEEYSYNASKYRGTTVTVVCAEIGGIVF
jgi:ATP-dependent HslUV protease ATP-binding subunit HslU